MNPQTPLPYRIAARLELDCIARTAVLLAQHRIQPRQDHSGLQLYFANGTSALVYQETVVDSGMSEDPCVLIVEFRLRGMRGWLHTIFRWESMLNTPLARCSRLGDHFAQHGYVFVGQNLRGTYSSDGQYGGWLSNARQEADDGCDTVE